MKELNKSSISWILSRIVLWLAMWILPALIKIVNQSWTCLRWNIPFKYIWSPSFMKLPSHPDMDLILCSKRLIVVSLLFFFMVLLSSSNQIVNRNVLASSMMFILSLIFMRWSAPLIFKTDGLIVSPDGVHLFNIHLHLVVCPHRSITMFKRLNPDKDVLQVQQHSYLSLEFTRSWLSLNNIAPSVIWMCLFIDYLSLSHIVLRSPILYLIIFLCLPA